MSGIIWAIIAGIGFGLFQVLNRKAGSRIDALRGTFSLLASSAVVLAAASLATDDLALLRRISLVTIFNFAMAGLIHFLLGWTFLTVSQHLERVNLRVWQGAGLIVAGSLILTFYR